jgi:hypothetical protein
LRASSRIILILVSVGGLGAFFVSPKPAFADNKPALIYHGVSTHSWSSLITPGSGQADRIKSEVDAYEAAVGRPVAWVAFGHEWHTDGPGFPVAVATSIKNRGATPLIYLTLRSADDGQPDPVYNLAAIIAGKFDSDLTAWADAAKNFGSEIIVSWGWEMNGDWAAWSGALNGGSTLGPKRFREAYRHIVELMRNRGANNIRWAFHINFPEFPDEPWNAFENYYPGDDVIDIIGASIYSAQFPTDDFFPSFESLMNPAYSRLNQMAPSKPIFVFEFGVTAGHPLGDSGTWVDEALAGILSGRWPAVRGFAWWNDYWSQDDNPAHDTEMRVERLPELATVFKSRLSGANIVGDRPPIRAGATLSKLSVSGNRIVTEEGQEVRLRGVNFTDPFLLEKDDFDNDGDGVADNHFAEIAEDFARVKELGANVVRLAIYPGYYRLVGGERYLTTYVDRMVDLAEGNGLYLIIDYHAIGRPGGWYSSEDDATLFDYPAKVMYTDTDMAVAFWDKVATRYGERNHVLFEIYNEPADETADFTWADGRTFDCSHPSAFGQHCPRTRSLLYDRSFRRARESVQGCQSRLCRPHLS